MEEISISKLGKKVWSKKVQCTGNGEYDKKPCFKAYKIFKSDIKKITYYDLIGGLTIYGFKCPNCGCFTKIAKKDIPHKIRNIAGYYDK